MSMAGVWLACTSLAVTCMAAQAQPLDPASGSQSARQIPGARQVVEQAARAELAADANDHSLWLYFENDRKPGNVTVQWAAETRQGEVDRVLQQDGRRLSPAEQSSRMDRFIHDSSAQQKQRRGGDQDDKRAAAMLNMLPHAFIWTIVKQTGADTVLHFRPDPSFHAPTWESRVFAGMEGDLVVANAGHRIESLRGKLIHEVKFGWGLFGALEPGGSFDVERRQLAHGIWQITETHVHIQGHALIFHTISDQEDDVKSKFEPLPANITLEQAEQKLMAVQ